jgi:glycolate oxidase FAD binding subunit
LLIGSLGTLAVITRVNFRTFPMPPAQGMFVASFADGEAAFEFCRAISRSVLTPQMVEVADPDAARIILSREAAEWIAPTRWTVVISAAGQPAVVDRYARELDHMARAANAAKFLPVGEGEQSLIFDHIREFPRLILEASPDAAIFRIGILPTAMPSLLNNLAEIASRQGIALATLTRASGIAYAAFFAKPENGVSAAMTASVIQDVFRICARPEIGAQAMVEWCPTELKTSLDIVWGPARPDFELMRRVKHSFDPENVLAPGRFAGGI